MKASGMTVVTNLELDIAEGAACASPSVGAPSFDPQSDSIFTQTRNQSGAVLGAGGNRDGKKKNAGAKKYSVRATDVERKDCV